MLIIRVQAADTATSSSEEVLSDKIFGSDGDPVNLKSQFAKCSYDQLVWDKVTNNGVVGGDSVYTVTIPNTVAGSENGVIREAAINKAAQDLGGVGGTNPFSHIADYVMVCVPPGTNGGWIAYAYVNYWQSVYVSQYPRCD